MDTCVDRLVINGFGQLASWMGDNFVIMKDDAFSVSVKSEVASVKFSTLWGEYTISAGGMRSNSWLSVYGSSNIENGRGECFQTEQYPYNMYGWERVEREIISNEISGCFYSKKKENHD
jgi:hypothetical protein